MNSETQDPGENKADNSEESGISRLLAGSTNVEEEASSGFETGDIDSETSD